MAVNQSRSLATAGHRTPGGPAERAQGDVPEMPLSWSASGFQGHGAGATGWRAAFTMVEILVVIGVIVLLMGISYPVYTHSIERSRIDATSALVAGVAASLATQPLTALVPSRSQAGHPAIDAKMISIALWDVNGDGILDGSIAVGSSAAGRDPVDCSDRQIYADRFATNDNLAAGLEAIGYGGFLHGTGFQPAGKSVNAAGQVVDAWGTPLRYLYAPLVRSAAAGAPGLVTDTTFFIKPGRDPALLAKQAAIAESIGGSRFCVWSAGPDRLDNTPDDIISSP